MPNPISVQGSSLPQNYNFKPTQKSLLRHICDKIVAFVKTVFNTIFCCFRCNRKKHLTEQEKQQIQEATRKQLEKNREPSIPIDPNALNGAAQPKANEVPAAPPLAVKKENNEVVTEDVKDYSHLKQHLSVRAKPIRGETLKDKALSLGEDVIEAATNEVVEQKVFPYVEKINGYAQNLNSSMGDINTLLSFITSKLSFSASSSEKSDLLNTPEDIRRDEEKLHTGMFIDFIKLTVGSENVVAFLNKYLPGNGANDQIKPFIAPAIDWLKNCYNVAGGDENYTSFKDFLKTSQNPEFQKLSGQYNNEVRVALMEYALAKMSELFTEQLTNHVNGQKAALKQLESEKVVIQNVQELIDGNLRTVSEVVLSRIMDLFAQVDTRNVIYRSIPHLTNQLKGVAEPVPAAEFSQQGVSLTNSVFPLIEQDGKQIRLTEYIVQQLKMPELLAQIKLPSMELLLEGFITKVKDRQLTAEEKVAVKRQLERFTKFLVLSVVRSQATSVIETAVAKLQDPFFIHDLIGNTVLPTTIEKIIVIFSKQVLSRNITQDLVEDFQALAQADQLDELAIGDTINDIKQKWLSLMKDSKVGFNAFNEDAFQDFGADKFSTVLHTVIEDLHKRLKEAREAHGDKFTDAVVRDVLQNYFNPVSNDKEVSLGTLLAKSQGSFIDLKMVASELSTRSSLLDVQFVQPTGENHFAYELLEPFVKQASANLAASDDKGPKAVKEAIEKALVVDQPSSAKQKSVVETFKDYLNASENDKDAKLDLITKSLLDSIVFKQSDVTFTLAQTGVTVEAFRSSARKFVEKVVAANPTNDTLEGVIKEVSNPKLAGIGKFIQTILQEGEFFKDFYFGNYITSQIQKQDMLIAKVVMDSMISTDDILKITFDSLRNMWTDEQTKKISMDKVLFRKPSPEQEELNKIKADDSLTEEQKEQRIKALEMSNNIKKVQAVSKRMAQFTSLIADFSGQLINNMAGGLAQNYVASKRWNIGGLFSAPAAYLGKKVGGLVSGYANPESLNNAIMKVFNKLFFDLENNGNNLVAVKEKNKQILTSVVRELLGDLNIASQKLAAFPQYRAAAL